MHDPEVAELLSRKLAVSFHVVSEGGPMIWHAKALTTSDITAPVAGATDESEDEAAFPSPRPGTSSMLSTWWHRGTPPTPMRSSYLATRSPRHGIEGERRDRWPNVLTRLLHAALGDNIAVVNVGIGGNQAAGHPSIRRKSRFRRAIAKEPASATCCR